MTQHRITRIVGASVVMVAMAVSGCAAGDRPSGDGGEPSGTIGVPVVDTITVAESRAALEAGQGEIHRILERELGRDGWTEARPAQENASSSCGGTPGVGKFYAAEMSHPGALEGQQWERVWGATVRAVAPHGFRPALAPESESEEVAVGSGHYKYLVSEHGDELTVSSQPRIGTGYGGFSVCHPWD